MRVQRSVLVLLGGAGVLLLVGVVVAIAASRQRPAEYPEGSPEATVAMFVRLLEDGELDRAYELTAIPKLSRDRFVEQFDPEDRPPRRVTLVRSSVDRDRAAVVVDVSTFTADGAPLDTSDQTYRQTFRLRREGGGWVITGPEYLGL